MKTIATIFLPILVIASMAFAVRYHLTHKKIVETPLTVTVNETHPHKLVLDTDTLSVDITYPVIPGTGKAVEDANASLKTEIDGRVEAFKKDAADSASPDIDLPADIKSTAAGSATIEQRNDRYVSIYMGMEWYTRGAAHPFHTITTYVYDYKEGKLVTVPDMFTNGSAYLQLLSKLSREDLKLQSKQGDTGYVYEADAVKEGTIPNTTNFSKILPLHDGLAVYFEEYQVAAYAAGPQTVMIPYSKLQDVINPDGVLGMYLK